MGKLQFNKYLPAIAVSLCLCLASVQVMAAIEPDAYSRLMEVRQPDGSYLFDKSNSREIVVYKPQKVQNKHGDWFTRTKAKQVGAGIVVGGLTLASGGTLLAAGSAIVTAYSLYQVYKNEFAGEPDYMPQSDGTVLHRGQQLVWYFSQPFNPASNSCTGSIHDSRCYPTSDAAVSGLVAYDYPGQTPTKVECSDSSCLVWFGSHFNGVRSIVKGEAIYPLSAAELESILSKRDLKMSPEVYELLKEALKNRELVNKNGVTDKPDTYKDDKGNPIPVGVPTPYGKKRTSESVVRDSNGNIVSKTTSETQPFIKVDSSGNAKLWEETTQTTTQYDPATGAVNNQSSVNTTESETTTNVKPDDDPSLICKLLPNILACQEMDTPPEQQIPKETKTVTLQDADLGFGGGSCPADAVVTLSGKQYTIVQWSKICPYLTGYVKPLVLLLSAFISMMIIFRSSNESGGGVV